MRWGNDRNLPQLRVVGMPATVGLSAWPLDDATTYELGSIAARLLASFLRIAEPILLGAPVEVDGLTPLGKPLVVTTTRAYEVASTFRGLEPAIAFASHLFSRLLSRFELTWRGVPVEVDGFRMRAPSRWANYPATALEAVGPLSSYCNVKCKFCYEQGSELPFNARFLAVGTAKARLEHYDVRRKRALPIGNTFSLEALANPQAIEILRHARAVNSTELFKLTSHGSNLTDEIVDGLASVQPIVIVVSLNSTNEPIRRVLMKDRHAQVALSAIPKLRARGIPVIGSIVPWHTLPLDDIEATIRYYDEQRVRMIRISLPSFTKAFAKEDTFDTQEVWGRIIERVLQVRKTIQTPINMMPTSYWQTDYSPVIDGVYRGSPAADARLRVGDLIVAVDGQPVVTRSQAESMLRQRNRSRATTEIDVERDGELIRATVAPISQSAEDRYPYKPAGYAAPEDPYGIFLTGAFRLSYFKRIETAIETAAARDVVLFVSKLMLPQYEGLAPLYPGYQDLTERSGIKVATAPCHYWGGNVMLGDLNVVSDFEQELGRVLARRRSRPELVLLPSTFLFHRGFDIQFTHYKALQRKFGVPVELVPCDVIMK